MINKVLGGMSAVLALAAALATLDLYAEWGFIDVMKRVYVETVMDETTYVGGAEKLGIKVHALSSDGHWCSEDIVFRMTIEKSEEVVSKQAAEFYMKRFGDRINDDDVCPVALSGEVYAYWGDAARPLLWGTSSAAVGWTEWEWENL